MLPTLTKDGQGWPLVRSSDVYMPETGIKVQKTRLYLWDQQSNIPKPYLIPHQMGNTEGLNEAYQFQRCKAEWP